MLEQYLGSPDTEHEIEDELSQVCAQLPSPFNDECQKIVDTYLPQLVQWIISNENPTVLCSQLDLC